MFIFGKILYFIVSILEGLCLVIEIKVNSIRKKLYNWCDNYWIDSYYKIETRDKISREDLSSNPNSFQYVPTSSRLFRSIMKELGDKKREMLIDFGSGKGRVLILAADFGYKNVIGVESSEILCNKCNDNIRKYKEKSRSLTNFNVVNSDASKYVIPCECENFFFFYPFSITIIAKVINNIYHSILDHPRKVTIIFVHPDESVERLFSSYTWLQKVKRIDNRQRVFYENKYANIYQSI